VVAEDEVGVSGLAVGGCDGRIWPHRDGCSGLHRDSVEGPDQSLFVTTMAHTSRRICGRLALMGVRRMPASPAVDRRGGGRVRLVVGSGGALERGVACA
jgi:hypothetical protein